MLARLLREPLVHFLVLGGVLFAIFGRAGSDPGVADKQIVVTSADIDRLAGGFSRTWHRPPSEDELRVQIDDFIREEVLYRTALSLGLDKDDTVVRRRLRQKMEFLFEDTVPEPQTAELRAYFRSHEDSYRGEPLFSFRQIFVSASRGAAAEANAERMFARLVAAGPSAEDEGDALLLGESFSETRLSRITALFGGDFAAALAQAEPRHWVGPLKSPYGFHLVLVTATKPAELPSFEQVRAAVQRDWFAERRAAALNAQYQALRAGYQIRVEYPSLGEAKP